MLPCTDPPLTHLEEAVAAACSEHEAGELDGREALLDAVHVGLGVHDLGFEVLLQLREEQREVGGAEGLQ